ncbi:RdgB/HAM1 family non-canonical purine NTP pyrophosphatase [Alphaproteobacteria bacterium]|nr:RdgB/HAM1 family non-canonical purine NTP pyrophosphatase [Alphaproteobacteria bacterium]
MRSRIFKDNQLVIASHNKGKIKEINQLLNPLKIDVLSAYDLDIEEPEENGKTFEENALIKSKFVSQKTRLPCISDDSGICFSDLNNEPGIYSARWAGKEKNFTIAMLKINENIKKINNPSYDCHFICSLSICWPDGYDVTVSGRVDGKFSWPPRGDKGFGYDPIFKPTGYKKTFAEMKPKFKHSISHRSIAFNKLIKFCFPSLKS